MTNESVVRAGKKERKHLHLPIMYYAALDDWAEKIGYKGFVWWQKLHTYVNRTDSAFMDSHIPYTMESLATDYFKVSRQTFYTTIKPLWEFGLIDIVTYDVDKRNSQKPKNIIVYEYPFNDINRKYEPLEKLRDWKKDYQSESKLSGRKGAFARKLSTKADDPSKNLRVENNVDNDDFDPSKNLRVDPSKNLRVTRPKTRHINITNKLLITTNKSINNSNNLILSHPEYELIDNILTNSNFTHIEREKIIYAIHNEQLKISIDQIKKQLQHMSTKSEIRNRVVYFMNGMRDNEFRQDTQPIIQTTEHVRKVPFYNWLEDRDDKKVNIPLEDLPY